MNSGLFKINSKDIFKGLVTTVFTAVMIFLGKQLEIDTFYSLDWSEVIAVAITAGFGYLAKNLFSDQTGKVLGRWG